MKRENVEMAKVPAGSLLAVVLFELPRDGDSPAVPSSLVAVFAERSELEALAGAGRKKLEQEFEMILRAILSSTIMSKPWSQQEAKLQNL